MIVVVGSPIARPVPNGIAAGGLASAVALAAAAVGSAVEVVGRIGEDAAGEQVLLDLAAAGVGHVAILREAVHETPSEAPGPGLSASPDGPDLGEALLADEPSDASASDDPATAPEPAGLSMDAGDLQLALRYLPDYRVVIIAAELEPAALASVVAAAAWAGAQLVVLVGAGRVPAALPADATVLERPGADPDGAFARMVATYAVALDGGREPGLAFSEASGGGGWAAVRN